MVSDNTPDNPPEGELSLELDAAVIGEARSNLHADETLDSLIDNLLREKIAERKKISR